MVIHGKQNELEILRPKSEHRNKREVLRSLFMNITEVLIKFYIYIYIYTYYVLYYPVDLDLVVL